jgi:hypothetical protein
VHSSLKSGHVRVHSQTSGLVDHESQSYVQSYILQVDHESHFQLRTLTPPTNDALSLICTRHSHSMHSQSQSQYALSSICTRHSHAQRACLLCPTRVYALSLICTRHSHTQHVCPNAHPHSQRTCMQGASGQCPLHCHESRAG